MTIAENLPGFLRHQGFWDGEYRYVDARGRIVDRHHSTVEVRFPRKGDWDYVQKNRWVWPDGRSQHAELPGTYRDGKVHFDNDILTGVAWQGAPDILLLTWTRHEDPGVSLFEMIVINEYDDRRCRTWHWLEDGVCIRRTLIDEIKVGP